MAYAPVDHGPGHADDEPTGGLEFPKPQLVIGWISIVVMLAVAGCMLTGFALP